MTSRVGKDLYIGTIEDTRLEDLPEVQSRLQEKLSDYRVHLLDTQGHTDGTFCPVVPGLILSIMGESTYKDTFPEWEVVPLRAEVYEKAGSWLDFKNKNAGKWWVPGEELNDDFTNFVEEWMNHWVGYIEESVFDLNLIVVDTKNVIVNGYNKKVFDTFSRYGITPHVCNFRHRFFWDGGLHCITSDIHREGTMTDWFPQRNQ
jgi:N-dimethylarginine dimethylaminohydrolase